MVTYGLIALLPGLKVSGPWIHSLKTSKEALMETSREAWTFHWSLRMLDGSQRYMVGFVAQIRTELKLKL